MIDIHALSGAYAVDALDDLERADFERHLAQCPACRVEVDSLREATALLAETVAVTPPARLRASILAQIALVQPLPPAVTPVVETSDVAGVASLSAHREARVGRRRWLPGIAAAAAVVAVLGVGTAVVQPWDDDSTSQSPGSSLTAADLVLQAPDATTFKAASPAGTPISIVRSAKLNQAVVVADDLGPAPEGMVYELWLQHGGTMVPAGLMSSGSDEAVLLTGDPVTAAGAGITVEPAGGSEKPTGDVVALIPFTDA